MDRARILSEARAAIQASDIKKGRKRRILRRLSRSERVQDMVIDEVIAQSIGASILDVHTEAIDWDAIIEFIEKLIPLIIKLIELFG